MHKDTSRRAALDALVECALEEVAPENLSNNQGDEALAGHHLMHMLRAHSVEFRAQDWHQVLYWRISLSAVMLGYHGRAIISHSFLWLQKSLAQV